MKARPIRPMVGIRRLLLALAWQVSCDLPDLALLTSLDVVRTVADCGDLCGSSVSAISKYPR